MSRSQRRLFYVDGNFRYGLNGVGMEVDVGFGGNRADGFGILQDTGLVVRQHDGDQFCIRTESVLYGFGID